MEPLIGVRRLSGFETLNTDKPSFRYDALVQVYHRMNLQLSAQADTALTLYLSKLVRSCISEALRLRRASDPGTEETNDHGQARHQVHDVLVEAVQVPPLHRDARRGASHALAADAGRRSRRAARSLDEPLTRHQETNTMTNDSHIERERDRAQDRVSRGLTEIEAFSRRALARASLREAEVHELAELLASVQVTLDAARDRDFYTEMLKPPDVREPTVTITPSRESAKFWHVVPDGKGGFLTVEPIGIVVRS